MTAGVDTLIVSDLYEPPEGDEGRKAWQVDCLGKATWALEKSAELARRQEEIRKVAQANIQRWHEWERAETAKFDRDRDFLEDAVADYALRRRAEDPKRNKTLVTPFGTVKTHESTGKWVVDDVVAIAWARAHRPELVKEGAATFALGEAKKAFVITEAGVLDPVTGTLVEGLTPGEKRITTTLSLDLGAS